MKEQARIIIRRIKLSISMNEYQARIQKVAYSCSAEAIEQLGLYLAIYEKQHCTEHWHVNAFISANNLWGEFDNLRSHNTHENGYIAEGILPKYFAIICEALKIEDSGGSRLLDSVSY